jgi:dinuclear metal center YbgI/SA1388 family protein
MNRNELISYTNNLLQIDKFRDYCPNGLQVEGRNAIRKIVTGVTACQALIDAAILAGADALLVHHAFFWRNENPVITGMKKQRLGALLKHDMNLMAYHLPLDAHLTLGNNIQLAQRLGWLTTGRLAEQGDAALIFHGELTTPQTAADFNQQLSAGLGRPCLHIGDANATIRTIAWCTGAAHSYIEQVLGHNIDAYISGEISEHTTHVARENGIHYFAAGHHATERYGIQALGEHLAEVFGIQHQFIDIDNPV